MFFGQQKVTGLETNALTEHHFKAANPYTLYVNYAPTPNLINMGEYNNTYKHFQNKTRDTSQFSSNLK